MVEEKIKKTDFKKLERTETVEWVGVSLSKYDLRQHLIRSASSLMFQADVIQRYLIGDLLGMGSYGIVKQCIDSITLRRMAVKMFVAKRIRRIPNGPENILNELKIMRKIKHENIVRVYNIVSRDEDHFMMMELCKYNLGNSLEHLDDNRLPLIVAQHFYKHLVNGMDYLQSANIIHMDIKPDNMLISFDNILKISDFSVAQQLNMFDGGDDTCTRYRGCPIIQPPEVARGDDSFSGFKLDIWCSGVTLYKMIVGEYPFDAVNEFLLIEKVIRGTYSIPDWLNSEVAVLIKGGLLDYLLQYDAKNRPTIKQVLNHNWLEVSYTEEELEEELHVMHEETDDALRDMLHKFHDEDDENGEYRKEEVIHTVDFMAMDKPV